MVHGDIGLMVIVLVDHRLKYMYKQQMDLTNFAFVSMWNNT